MNQEKIGKLIAKLRKEKKLTQEQLGAKLGVNSKAVSKWECGLTTPDISIVNELSNILGISTTELLEGKQKTNINNQNNFRERIKIFFVNNIIFLLTLFILFIICMFLFIFFINNYKKYQLISYKLIDTNFYANGYIAIYPNKELIILNDLVYQSKEKGTKNELKIEQLKINIINDKETIFEYIFEREYDIHGKVKKYFISEILENFSTITISNEKNSIFIDKELKLLIEYEVDEKISTEEYKLDVTVEENSSKFIN
ncbi:MAG: helix-turn-helix transcriptional regulator [Firmicutes bacterium]|nr:helix-turn-helix transcriptional regulator [Bacillota bacterium]